MSGNCIYRYDNWVGVIFVDFNYSYYANLFLVNVCNYATSEDVMTGRLRNEFMLNISCMCIVLLRIKI